MNRYHLYAFLYVSVWVSTLFYSTDYLNIYFDRYYFIVMWIFLSIFSGIFVYLLIPIVFKKIIWRGQKKGDNHEYGVSIFIGFSTVPFILLLNSLTLGDYVLDEYEIKKIKVFRDRSTSGLIFSVYNEYEKVKFYKAKGLFEDIVGKNDVSQVYNSSELNNLTLNQQRELILLANSITLESRSTLLGLSEVKDAKCNYLY